MGPDKVAVKVNVAAWLGIAIAINRMTGKVRMNIDLNRVMARCSLFTTPCNARSTFEPLRFNPEFVCALLCRMNTIGLHSIRDPVLHLSGDVRMSGEKSIRKSDTLYEIVVDSFLQVIEVVTSHEIETHG